MAEDETTFSVKDAADYLGRSVPWLKDESRRAILEAGGATLGSRGVSAVIPKALLDAQDGWKQEKRTRKPRVARAAAPVSGSRYTYLHDEISALEAEWEDAKEKAGSLGGVIKEKQKELQRLQREEQREVEKVKRAEERELRKRLAKAEEEAERIRADLAAVEQG